MKLIDKVLVGILVLGASSAQAAYKDYSVKYRLAVMNDGRLVHEPQRQPYNFRVEIISDNEGTKYETSKNGRPFITAAKGEGYAVRLYNPLPVRVAVNLTVDGLNSISGKPSGISDGQKWMIDPYGTITIKGWQVNGEEARRFFFTEKPKSYAKWRGDELGKDLSANCGVIGAAYFWNQQELNAYYDAHPIYRYTQRIVPHTENYTKAYDSETQVRSASGASAAEPAAAREPRVSVSNVQDMKMKAEEPQEQAGTGMGERESNPTTQVEFNYNTGMYSLAQAVVIYYDFAKVSNPNPFPDMSFAPEMEPR